MAVSTEARISTAPQGDENPKVQDREGMFRRAWHAFQTTIIYDILAAPFAPSDDYSQPVGKYWRDHPELDSMYYPKSDAMRAARQRAEQQGMQF